MPAHGDDSNSGSARDAAGTPGSVIPLFPLSHVLLPGMPLPLHIFEPRYRQLLLDISSGPGTPSFGIVTLTRGTEVGTEGVDEEPQFALVGTVAEVLEVEPFDDGASDLLTVGSRRFRIERLVPGKPYLQAEVQYLDERDGGDTGTLREIVLGLQDQHAMLIHALTGRQSDMVLPTDPNQLSYHLAAQLPLTSEDRQQLLEAPDAVVRLARSAVLLRREIALLRATRTIAVASRVLQLHLSLN
ncbi:LON peptidase substrate-binding domain-containing protein [Jatrophihabitans cynanchi]|uniref:LON peptidase substrate-binding domain-containing protein n=1 Tax=Jatrophihabitans cynanchi TaxID=2944128 RepID=A0ABY7JZQ8_9ACTN|nr:LON peptidase substrate-binding domain-containing protein [Jatrophihabitans sp. SB3-54]WAX56827.1 LON peptidase substrate-binding domain-containing protein [Jatrophihabitans sp. SB3-54]